MSLLTKTFEVRDAATFVSVCATLLLSGQQSDRYLLRRAGYTDPMIRTVIVTRLHDCETENEPYDWTNRTMRVAHQHIQDNFENLESGSVIDVEYILGESQHPKMSERFELIM